jgi:hypothetical protein
VWCFWRTVPRTLLSGLFAVELIEQFVGSLLMWLRQLNKQAERLPSRLNSGLCARTRSGVHSRHDGCLQNWRRTKS